MKCENKKSQSVSENKKLTRLRLRGGEPARLDAKTSSAWVFGPGQRQTEELWKSHSHTGPSTHIHTSKHTHSDICLFRKKRATNRALELEQFVKRGTNRGDHKQSIHNINDNKNKKSETYTHTHTPDVE